MENKATIAPTLPLNEVKVVFLGDGDTGKSHIVARLMNDGGMPLDRADVATPGIVIKHKDYDLDGRRLRVHFWDFGGQEILHSMHRIFLTPRTVYVVVVNAQDGTQNDRARYWLHNVKSFAPDAPVLLVLNKTDQNTNAHLDERDLRTRFPRLTRVVQLSALKFNREIFNWTFTDVLLEEIQKSGFPDTRWPASWMKLKHALERAKSPYITNRDYLRLCGEAGVDTNQRDLLHWFNDLGISFCFGDDYKLDNYIVLWPGWITNALYILMLNRCEGEHNGRIPLTSIYRLLGTAHNNPNIRCTLPQARYDHPGDVPYILGIMHKFQLSFQCGSEHEFIPMLSQRPSAIDIRPYEQDPAVLEFRMEFDYLPENLLHRLMVERHQQLDMEAVWLTGARFRLPGTGLSAVVMKEGNWLRFFIEASDPMQRPNTYLTLLKSNVERIAQDMGLQSPRNSLIFKARGKRILFDYERLLRMQARGMRKEYCPELDEDFLIADILKQSAPEGVAEEKLLDDIRRSCLTMQSDIRYRTSGAYARNTWLRNDLALRGYVVSDQSRWGERGADGGTELLVMDERRSPWAAIQAHSTRGWSTRAWEQQLNTLLYSYQPLGLSTVFWVNLVDCEKPDFNAVCATYIHRIQTFNPSRGMLEPASFWTVSNPGDELIRIARSAYRIGGSSTTVYHVIVWMEGSGDDQQVLEEYGRKINPEFIRHSELVQTECRVVFLGDSEAGKSLIMSRVENPQMKPSDFHGNTTIGIDIFSKTEIINGQRVRINFWDFGGQEILHSMHRMFLSENTMYVIILNTRNDNQDAQANFWMRYVQSYALGAPVMLVMNKVDQNKRAALNLPLLQRQFMQEFDAENVLKISAVEPNPEVFENAFTKKLYGFIAAHINSFQGFTPQEVWIRDKVEETKQKKKIMSRDDFRLICEAEDLYDPDDQEELMDRFHDAGIMVHFGEESPMFLNPKWITGAIYRILDAGEQIAHNGVVPLSEIQRLCRENPDKWRGSEDANELVRIMRQYALSFQYESRVPGVKDTKNQEFIPMLCQREEPKAIEELISAEHTLEMQLVFEYLPSGLLYKLMVDHQKTVDTTLTWFTGVKIGREKENYTIIRRCGNVLSIYTNYASRAEAVEKLYEFANRVEKLAGEEKYHANLLEKRIKYEVNGAAQYFDLERLKDAQRCEVNYTVFSGKKPKKVAVRDILEQEDRSRERETEELLQKIAAACSKLQERAAFMDRQEDVRNNKLLDQLGETYRVEGQAQIGEAPSGKRQNELDLLIRYPDGNPWVILEALNVSHHTSMTYWDKHLNKLVGRYNASWGLRQLVLVSYVDCKEAGYRTLYEKFRDHMKMYVPEGCQIREESFDHCDLLSSEKNYLQVDQCTYSRGGQSVTVCHYFVRMGDKEPTKTEAAAEEEAYVAAQPSCPLKPAEIL